MNNKEAAVWITILLLGFFGFCFFLTFFSLRLTQRLQSFVEESGKASPNQVSPSLNAEEES
jgi:hypothetical protein